MATVTVTQHVQAPLERVFEIFTDLRKAPERITGIQSLDVLSPGDVGAGTRFRETRVMFGKEATEEMQVTEFEPNRSYAVEADSHGCLYRSEFVFEPKGDGTDVTMTFGATPYTLGAKLMSPLGKLMAGSVRKACGQDMADLAVFAEKS